jgi:hypothetical protein
MTSGRKNKRGSGFGRGIELPSAGQGGRPWVVDFDWNGWCGKEVDLDLVVAGLVGFSLAE